MALFRYRAVNGAGKTVRGEIEAADATAAGTALRRQGLFPMRLDPVEERTGGRLGGKAWGAGIGPRRRDRAGGGSADTAEAMVGPGSGSPVPGGRASRAVPAAGESTPPMGEWVSQPGGGSAIGRAPGAVGTAAAAGTAAAGTAAAGAAKAAEPAGADGSGAPGFAPVRAGRSGTVPVLDRQGKTGTAVGGAPSAARWWQRQVGSRRVPVQALAVFCRQFATLIRAGVPAARTVEILQDQSENRELRRALGAVAIEVRRGSALREAFAGHPAVFPPLLTHMIGAGEFSGQLDLMLDRAALFYEQERATKQKIASALMYPAVVLVIALGVAVFLLTSVIPTLAATFAQQGAALPLATRITLGLSHFLTERWYVALALLAAVIAATVAGSRTPAGQEWKARLALGLPVFGRLNRKHAVAQFSRTFATLLRAAVPILDGLDLTKKVMGNALYEKALSEAQEQLRSGRTMAEALGHYPRLFPPMVVQMVAVGEETGTLDNLLDKLADFYEADVREMAARLGALLEPMMIVFLAVIVGLIILSVYLPMFQMMNFVGS